MSKPREFDPTQIIIDNKPVRAFKIECGRCHAIHKVTINTSAQGGIHGHEMIWARRKFEQDAWRTDDRTERRDRCPKCKVLDDNERTSRMKPIQQPAQRSNGAAVVASSSKPQAPAELSGTEPVRQMQREDRRLILARLQDVYESEATGYGPGWTDAKVAKDMGVPRQWVETLRDENFGPVKINAEIMEQINTAYKIMSDAADLVRAVQLAKTSVNEAIKLIETRLGPLTAMMDRTQRSIADIEKALS